MTEDMTEVQKTAATPCVHCGGKQYLTFRKTKMVEGKPMVTDERRPCMYCQRGAEHKQFIAK